MFEKQKKPVFAEVACEVTVTAISEGSFQGQTGEVKKYSGVMERENGTFVLFEAFGKTLEGVKIGDKLSVRLEFNTRSYTWQNVRRYKLECRVTDAKQLAPSTTRVF